MAMVQFAVIIGHVNIEPDTLLQFSNLGSANNIFVGLNGGMTALEHAALPGEEL